MPLKVPKKEKMFKKADIDNDDKIDFEEFIKSIEKIIEDDRYVGYNFWKFRIAFRKADNDKDGLISIDEFRSFLIILNQNLLIYFRNAIDELEKELHLYDFKDKDRETIQKQKEKLKKLLKKKKLFGLIKNNKIKEMFEDADSDKDKLIDFEEFLDSLKNIKIIPIKPKYC